MEKKAGISYIIIIVSILIGIVLTIVIFNFYNMYKESKSLRKIVEEKELDYYLPADFALLKINRGSWEVEINGVRIAFTDNLNKKYYYQSYDYPLTGESKEYEIMKDELTPKIPEDWDFTRVKYISFSFVMPDGKLSKEVYTINVDKQKASQNFDNNCVLLEEGENSSTIVCD